MNSTIKKNTNTALIVRVIHIVAWIIFVGLCIKTGAILFSFLVSLAINPAATKNLYMVLNLSELYRFSMRDYVTLVSLMIFLSALKAFMFYLVIKIFLKINYVQPFGTEASLLISRLSYVALGIGLLTIVANSYTDWLIKKGVALPDLQAYLGAGAEFLFSAGIIFFIAQVFKKGIEIQAENELTV